MPQDVIYKTPEQIEKMRRAGGLVHEALRRCRAACRPGVTTAEINAEAQRVIDETPGAVGLFKNYPAPSPRTPAFPAVTCISINEEVVHGIPGDRVIREGDLVSVDCGIRIDGWCGDSATTIMVGNVSAEDRRLCEVTEHVLRIAIENIRPGRRWSQVAQRMQDYAERAGMGVVRDFVGHGIGQSMHESPKVPNFVSDDLLRHDILLKPGLVLAVEPMCCLGTDRVKVLKDGWTVVTADKKAAAHYEHTIAVTDSGCTVLTDGSDGKNG
ncbi:MAG: type I methionyl aminopeptidase [Phycisphaera sp.]|nr:type I methionyl aminopeptidase [Phycisphaera sp.]